MSDKKLVTFFDMLGRTIIGECTNETSDVLTIKNPVVVNIVPQRTQDPATGQVVERMALQLLPLFFREFLADRNSGISYNYKKNNITMTENDVVFDFKLSVQYDNLFAEPDGVMAPAPQQTAQTQDNVIKLFED